VHHAARFMPKDSIRRALFVGGGDSMLLHEILKYPSLELVVGLELDQKVTRGCFKHFGTQPHFHDSRVEWWFGDASKSLLMLPKEYFGSFDLVLVDLSETVMSFQVTDEIDVVEALSLLVKPDGVFVKNEVYFDKFRNMFPYSVLINW
jgi:spermidine synthase